MGRPLRFFVDFRHLAIQSRDDPLDPLVPIKERIPGRGRDEGQHLFRSRLNGLCKRIDNRGGFPLLYGRRVQFRFCANGRVQWHIRSKLQSYIWGMRTNDTGTIRLLSCSSTPLKIVKNRVEIIHDPLYFGIGTGLSRGSTGEYS